MTYSILRWPTARPWALTANSNWPKRCGGCNPELSKKKSPRCRRPGRPTYSGVSDWRESQRSLKRPPIDPEVRRLRLNHRPERGRIYDDYCGMFVKTS